MATTASIPKNDFRDEKYSKLESHFIGLDKNDVYAYSKALLSRAEFKPIFDPWVESVKTPFSGITTDGTKIEGVYKLEENRAPTDEMVAAANLVLEVLTPEERARVTGDLDAEHWRKWSNPEFIFFNDCGLRLDHGVKKETIDVILGLLRASLSQKGYEKVQAGLVTNEFLGDLINLPKILNRWSYFFMLHGTPSTTEPWGFTWHGHHVCVNVFVVGKQMVIGPCFIGAEPNVIDEGPHKGTFLLQEEEVTGLQLMQSLTPEQAKIAVLYPEMDGELLPKWRYNPADQRHLAGAYQDNRQIPYEGINCSELNDTQQALLWTVIESFQNILPEEPRKQRMAEVRAYLAETFFCWIGRYGDDDPFYYRIQSPVILLEFDHHSGLALDSERKPVKHHIHTIQRLPNGNDYGREVIRLFRESR
ncbi:uncharacterized protein N7496_001527 [Penicillium cataractarum]|uniref:DUF3500 domain-containing protein n=1 Tax=Penicillium cataractarum TaxID=2100454 RepID=A0A9W9VWI2_9EURO|nr:uncharacterized protein N7496_001527 [Penicillium cataractarum]KAJ5390459.1 hypothetical protein N7496_001527 [Penicillium cataractarum]